MSKEELETCKAIVRALLIADKRTFTVRHFLNEYKNSEGQELPFARFGYHDPLAFLRSLPDTVQVYQYGNDFCVRPTVTEDVQHVQKLVSRQKDSASKPSRTSLHQRRQGSYTSRSVSQPRTAMFYTPPSLTPPTKQPTPIRLVPVVPYQPPVAQKSAAAPSQVFALEQVKTNLRQLLDFHQSGINVRELEETYTKKYGTGINYTSFGYRSFEDFVVGMSSDVLCATRNSAGTMKVFRNKDDVVEVESNRMKNPTPTFAVHKPQTLTTSRPQNQRYQAPAAYSRSNNSSGIRVFFKYLDFLQRCTKNY